jgi:hypothetical protein
MIIQENINVNGVDLVKTYSDLYMVKQVETGIFYSEAIDVPNKYTYEETDTPKPVQELPEEVKELLEIKRSVFA